MSERFKVQESTQRIKPVLFDRVNEPQALVETASCAWDQANKELDYPLVQVRGIVPIAQEKELLRLAQVNGPFAVIARIPFKCEDEPVAIYYVQAESGNRPGYRFPEERLNITHDQALTRAAQRMSKGFGALPAGYTVRGLFPDSSGNVMNDVDDPQFNISTSELSRLLVKTHKDCFEYPHDPDQQDTASVEETLKNNPVVLAFDASENVSAVGLIERDDRFTLDPSITLVEPTYWTVPEHQHRGLSNHLRIKARELYDHTSVICFGESVRPTSFVLILATGYELAGNADQTISGDLGNAYTAIGPANPQSGYIPMGASYYTSRKISVDLDSRYDLSRKE